LIFQKKYAIIYIDLEKGDILWQKLK
jgi:hypothetical protein